ncbi:globin D, coelomic [Dermacentor silvarum]|uniref:globin D, coelomic n=1 Tax=Dermacentor silvarum TaxID=543639 RepID=UPI001897672E|nr:globin D, coelomic [Dermacentor silvarum]
MGHAFTKETINPHTGMTPTDIRLIKQTWRNLCDHNRNYGVLILQAFFHKQPDTMHLFRNFRGKPVQSLPEDMLFRAHACAFGYQLTSMVDNSDDVDLLEALIRRNAEGHRKHLGVMPMHFRIMGKAVVDVLQTKNDKLMTHDAVLAWEKLFTGNTLTAHVRSPKVASKRFLEEYHIPIVT